MKLHSVVAAAALSFVTAKAYGSTAIVLVAAKSAEVAQEMQADWKNEKQIGDKLFTAAPPELMTADQMKGLPAGQTALVLGVCDDAEAAALLPVLQALYPSTTGKSVENAPSSCPKLTSTPTKVSAKQTDKGAAATLTVALFDGNWDKGETLQVAIGHVRDKDGTLVDTYSQRAGTVLGGETCKADLKLTGHVITVNRTCEGTKEIETKKLSLAKSRLKID